MPKSGIGFIWNGVYWGSFTAEQPSTGGRDDVYFGPVGSGVHQHSWLKWAGKDLDELGTRMKDPSLDPRPPSNTTTSFSTAPLARFRASLDPVRQRVTTEIADLFSGSAIKARPSESNRTQSQRGIPMIPVAVPPETTFIEGEIAFCRAPEGCPLTELSTAGGFFPLSSDHSVGIAIRITRRSTR